jgi:phosphomevalonate kinase
MKLVTDACGKVMLAGEYAVLFGFPAVIAAINRKAHCFFEASAVMEFVSEAQALPKDCDRLFKVAISCLKQAGYEPMTGKYVLDTREFFDQEHQQKIGLGSSSAATVALCKLILAQHHIHDKYILFKLAYRAHRLLNDNFGSGADVAAAVYGDVISYSPEGNIEPILADVAFNDLIFIYTNCAQSSKPFVKQVCSLSQSAPDFLRSFCRRSAALSLDFTTNGHNFISLMDNFHAQYALLQELGQQAKIDIISQEHEAIYQTARAHKGSAKPSGAGGGDIAIAVVPKSMKSTFIQAIKRQGLAILSLSLDK